jgi:hypothetical protein
MAITLNTVPGFVNGASPTRLKTIKTIKTSSEPRREILWRRHIQRLDRLQGQKPAGRDGWHRAVQSGCQRLVVRSVVR